MDKMNPMDIFPQFFEIGKVQMKKLTFAGEIY